MASHTTKQAQWLILYLVIAKSREDYRYYIEQVKSTALIIAKRLTCKLGVAPSPQLMRLLTMAHLYSLPRVFRIPAIRTDTTFGHSRRCVRHAQRVAAAVITFCAHNLLTRKAWKGKPCQQALNTNSLPGAITQAGP